MVFSLLNELVSQSVLILVDAVSLPIVSTYIDSIGKFEFDSLAVIDYSRASI